MPFLPESVLRCPVCHHRLDLQPPAQQGTVHGAGGSRLLQCAAGHRFDAARQGYFNLLTGRGTAFEADTAAMVQARIDFLGAGHYAGLANAVRDAALEYAAPRPMVLDAGAGTGYYLGALLDRVPASGAVALDISKFALRRVARQLPSVVCLVWDLWRPLPVADGSVDLLLNIFAPRNPHEFARVVADGGIVLVVTPLPHHLREIAAMAGLLGIRPGKDGDVAAGLSDSFDLVATSTVEFEMVLSPTDIHNVARMGPAGHHLPADQESLLSESMPVAAAFTLQVFRRRHRKVNV